MCIRDSVSPGYPSVVTTTSLEELSASSVSVNPRLHSVLRKMEIAEESGLGMRALRATGAKIRWEEPNLVVSLPIREDLDDVTRAILERLETTEGTQTSQLANELEVEIHTIRRRLKELEELGLARRTGTGRGTRYYFNSAT